MYLFQTLLQPFEITHLVPLPFHHLWPRIIQKLPTPQSNLLLYLEVFLWQSQLVIPYYYIIQIIFRDVVLQKTDLTELADVSTHSKTQLLQTSKFIHSEILARITRITTDGIENTIAG